MVMSTTKWLSHNNMLLGIIIIIDSIKLEAKAWRWAINYVSIMVTADFTNETNNRSYNSFICLEIIVL